MNTHREPRRGHPRRLDLLQPGMAQHDPTGELLVVTEATGEERGMLSVAELLARRDRINAHLIGVDRSSTDVAALTPEAVADLHAAEQRRLLTRTREELNRAVGRGAYWSTDAALGDVVAVVSEEVRKGHTRLVLVTLRDPETERLRAADTLVSLASAVDVPILAVPRHLELLPTRVLVATDFSRASIRAARTALSVLGPRGSMSLVHVEPAIDYDALGHPTWREESAQGVSRLFEELRRELDDEAHRLPALHRRRTSVVKETILLRGEPAPVILEYAAQHRNDLIVIGTRRVAAGDTLPLGSVSMGVLRAAQAAVLLAQPLSSSLAEAK
ncbi:MAG TPA: universal stress protein [Gemmatimonadaceae bacterium]|nr:universal stress protein [Gemmatimonadaceae bacterium]